MYRGDAGMVIPVTGTLVQCYYICRRQLWLMSRQLVPDQENPFIEIGRLIDNESFSRERKKIHFDNVVIDIVKKGDGELVVGEVKKSSKAYKSALMQLAFYLYKLKKNGIEASGELLFPEEKRRVAVDLTQELEGELEDVFLEIQKIAVRDKPPPAQKVGYCKNCGYREFCWS